MLFMNAKNSCEKTVQKDELKLEGINSFHNILAYGQNVSVSRLAG